MPLQYIRNTRHIHAPWWSFFYCWRSTKNIMSSFQRLLRRFTSFFTLLLHFFFSFIILLIQEKKSSFSNRTRPQKREIDSFLYCENAVLLFWWCDVTLCIYGVHIRIHLYEENDTWSNDKMLLYCYAKFKRYGEEE